MEHFHDNIFGYSDSTYFDVLDDALKRFDSGSHFVEIGALLGKSSAYMAVEIINSGKDIKFDVVDHWLGSSEHRDVQELQNLDFFEEFTKNMKPVEGYYNAIRLSSFEAADLYQDGSLDFVMIDGDHSRTAVENDISKWLPKIKSGGLMAGDDYTDSGVREACENLLQDNDVGQFSSWSTKWFFNKG
jgi:predicted O-methyltransferase YrrM|tara:strand:- start:1079 stop:1639 length:561 start_codon:yes stop_codon:yes gene_type:complete